MYEAKESPEILFRPVLKHTSRMLSDGDGARISYVVRITNDRDNTTIIKNSTNEVIFGIISEYLVGNLTDEECLYKLRCESSTNEVAMFNANSVQFV